MDKVTEAVCEDLKQRAEHGFKKYGKTLERTDLTLRQWLQHAYEEALDFSQYIKRVIMIIDENERNKNTHKHCDKPESCECNCSFCIEVKIRLKENVNEKE